MYPALFSDGSQSWKRSSRVGTCNVSRGSSERVRERPNETLQKVFQWTDCRSITTWNKPPPRTCLFFGSHFVLPDATRTYPANSCRHGSSPHWRRMGKDVGKWKVCSTTGLYSVFVLVHQSVPPLHVLYFPKSFRTQEDFCSLCSTIVEHQIRTQFSVCPSIAYVTQPEIFQCISHYLVFSNIYHTAKNLQWMSHFPVFFNVCHTPKNSSIYMTQHSFLQCNSHNPVFSNVCLTALNSPMYVSQPGILQCISHSPEFFNKCHTIQFSLMYVTQPSFLQCMSHKAVFSNVCHTAQNSTIQFSSMYVVQPWILQCMSHYSVFSNVCCRA